MAKRRNTPNATQSSLTSPASSFILKTNREPEPFTDILNMIKGHTDALKSATEKRAPLPPFPFGQDKENSTSLYRMLTASLTSVPAHLKSEVELFRKLMDANKLSEQKNIHERYAISHMGSSSGEFCKVIKVVTSPPLSTTSSKTQSSKVVLPTTRIMSIPEFEGRLQKLKNPTVDLPPVQVMSERDAETSSSDQYESAATDHYESATDRSSALSRVSDSTEISTFTSDGDIFDVTSCDITMVSYQGSF
jgi:hypothetical protein